jgi:hypothetical protein
MRADEEAPGRLICPAEHIADAVDDRVEPGLGIFLGEPMARGDIDLGIGRPVDAGLVAAEIGEAFEVGEKRCPSIFGMVWRNLSAN